MSAEKPQNRADQIRAAFEKFHAANPHVWSLFERFALEVIRAGWRNYSADAICHRVRWETSIMTRGGTLKINDHFTAYYARMFHENHPEHVGFFRNRGLISERQPAAKRDRQEFITA